MRAGANPEARLWELNPHPQLLPSSSLLDFIWQYTEDYNNYELWS